MAILEFGRREAEYVDGLRAGAEAWRDAVSVLLQACELEPVGEGEHPETALQRFCEAYGEHPDFSAHRKVRD